MKVGIMQPYFFPYIGYFQLIKSVDEFIIYVLFWLLYIITIITFINIVLVSKYYLNLKVFRHF